jgi:hypothetical protein
VCREFRNCANKADISRQARRAFVAESDVVLNREAIVSGMGLCARLTGAHWQRDVEIRPVLGGQPGPDPGSVRPRRREIAGRGGHPGPARPRRPAVLVRAGRGLRQRADTQLDGARHLAGPDRRRQRDLRALAPGRLPVTVSTAGDSVTITTAGPASHAANTAPRRHPHRAPGTPAGELPPAPAVRTGPAPAQGMAGGAGSEEFYRLLAGLAGAARRLRDCRAGDCPQGGVYFLLRRLRGPQRRQQPRGAGRHARADCCQQGHLVGPAPAAPRAPGRPRSRQWQPPGLGIPAARRGGAHPPRRAATGTARILARPPRPAPRLGPPGNRSRVGRQPPHRSHAGAVAERPGPRHPRRRRAEQHRPHLRAWPTARTSPAPAGSGTTPSPARSASQDCGTSSTSPDPADPASWPPSTS